MTWRPLEKAADKWLSAAHNAHPLGEAAPWQELIDALDDHNQTMIDSIASESPGLDAMITELMESDDDEAQNAWIAVVNHIFNIAQKKHGVQS
jgi:hypothetical protein